MISCCRTLVAWGQCRRRPTGAPRTLCPVSCRITKASSTEERPRPVRETLCTTPSIRWLRLKVPRSTHRRSAPLSVRQFTLILWTLLSRAPTVPPITPTTSLFFFPLSHHAASFGFPCIRLVVFQLNWRRKLNHPALFKTLHTFAFKSSCTAPRNLWIETSPYYKLELDRVDLWVLKRVLVHDGYHIGANWLVDV